jgi:hypothetical protein
MDTITKGIYGERNGFSIISVRRLGMWIYWKMKFEAFIHNDYAKCFHMVVQGTRKMVMMGYINFED